MTGALRLAGCAAALAWLGACNFLVGDWAGPDKGKQDRLIFSHRKHVVQEEVDCDDCHGEVARSTSIEDKRQMPREAACMECHDREDNCKMCHTDPKAPMRWIDHRMEGIRFDHSKHLARRTAGGKPVDCFTCHADKKTATRVSEDKRPNMLKTCATCHNRDFSREDCLKCHRNLVDNERMPLSIFRHAGNWLHRHGTAAKGAITVCGHCHTEPMCKECHARTNPSVMRPSLVHPARVDRRTHHRGDWIARHPIEARQNSTYCLTCHQEKRCIECHRERGVAPSEAPTGAGRTANHSPHGPDWMKPGASRFHGREARRAPFTCAACHDKGAASNCVTCHRVGGPGGNPHPAGWRSNLDKRRSVACIACHTN